MRSSTRVALSLTVFVGSIIILNSTPAHAQRGRGGPYVSRGLYDASARLHVTPRETEVYVDGYLVGTVDDFDGFTQRLRLDSGEHEIELYLKGHRPTRQLIFFQPGETYRIRHTMEPLSPGESEPERPTPRAAAAPAAGPSSAGPPPRGGAPATTTAGTIAIRVQPADAVILIDGERWQPSSSNSPLHVQVTAGVHRVEVQKDGYQPFTTTVQVRPGETAAINVSLTRPLIDPAEIDLSSRDFFLFQTHDHFSRGLTNCRRVEDALDDCPEYRQSFARHT